MKKLFALTFALIIMLSLFTVQVSAAAEMKIFRLTTAPSQDGKIDAGEYYLLADDSNYTFSYHDNSEGDAAAAKKAIYAGYDDNYLYIASTVTCENHINEWAFVPDGGANDYGIFNGHSSMIAVTSVNPSTDADCIATLTDSEWNWSEAFKSAIGRQFTIALTSDTGIQLSGVHFSHTSVYIPEPIVYTDPITQGTIHYNEANDANLPMTTDFFAVSHDNNAKIDVYEVKLPWGWIDYKTDKKGNKGDTIIPVERGDGTYCGLSVNLSTGDIDGEIYGNNGLAGINFGADNQIYFGKYVPLYLAGAADGSAVASIAAGSGISSGSSAGTTTKASADTTTAKSDDTTTASADAADTTTKKAERTTTAKKADTEKTTTTTEKSGDSDSNTGLIIGIIIGAVVLVAAIVVVIIVVSKKKKAAPAASEDKKD